ncbi:valine--tRNA ligase [Candidatus Dependentiae bacterium]
MDKRYDHHKFEQEAQKLWEQEKIYEFDANSKKETFSIDTPPPTVSGTLHTGHVFSYTHTDIIARYQRMIGKNIFYPMGFDDNGLPTEKYVEKKNKIKAQMLKRSEFIKLCLKETLEAEKDFENLWKRIGLSIDWTKLYSTISNKSRKISQLSFLDLYKKNLVYLKKEPSLYCTTCQTTVAQAELDDAPISSTFNDLEFETEDGQKLVISTTRPELLPACVAIFFNPEDERYKHLNGKLAIVPIFGQKVKILPDKKAQKDKGTGLVMCCTFGDQTDIFWYKTHKLSFIQIVGFDGKWTKEAGPLEGLRVHEARKKTIELLKEAGKLLEQKKIKHDVNVHERCKQEIEYLILNQWFVKILDHKKDFLKAADKIVWKPEFMKARYKDWVENLGWDWCISRQRFFGIPFPVWHCQDCKQVLLANTNDLPIDPQEQKFPGNKCTNCSGTNIKPDTDVMDTWNTSSLTPQINTNWPTNDQNINIPMSMRPQAHDIIRTWAFYTIVKAQYHLNIVPWKEIVISGHVLSGKAKISKSKGKSSVPTPTELLQNYPSDVIRYWTAQGKLGTDTAFSPNQLKIGQRLITKLWNAFRFCSEHIKNHSTEYKPKNLDHLTKWILHEFSKTNKTYFNYFSKYDYTLALETVEKFFWHNFCDNYVELIKDQIFNPDKYPENTIKNTRFALYEIGFGLLQLFAPILSHITESLYQNLYKDKENLVSIHITTFTKNRYEYDFQDSTNIINKIIQIVTQCRKLKTEKQVSLKTELNQLNIWCENKEILEQIKQQLNLIKGITKAKNITYQNNNQTELKQENDSWNMNIFIK